MAVSLVQIRSTAATGTAVALAFLSNVTAGNSIIVGVIHAQNATVTLSSVTDTLSNSYAANIGPIRNSNIDNLAQWIASVDDIAGGACTVTATTNGSPTEPIGIVIAEVSGLNTAGSYVASNSANGSSSVANAGNVTTTEAEAFIFAMCGSLFDEVTAGASFTAHDTPDTAWFDFAEYRVVTSSGTYAGQFATTVDEWGALVAAFQEAAAPGGGGAFVLKREYLSLKPMTGLY